MSAETAWAPPGYRIDKFIGRGGMGEVYLAWQVAIGRTVALKLIAPEWAQDDEYRRSFRREAELAASIDHPNVIEVYDAGEDGGRLYLAMHYIDGVDLRGLLAAAGALPPQRAVSIVAQIAEALDCAHSRGLVHRDVKPANALVADEQGREHVYLTDFGLTTRGLTETTRREGAIAGTLSYMAPEQARGERVDARADVYSLGCVLFELLAGRTPYPRGHPAAILFAHAFDPVPSISDLRPGVADTFDQVLSTAMAKDPADRYPSAGDLGRAARAALDGRTTIPIGAGIPAGPAAPEGDRATGREIDPAEIERLYNKMGHLRMPLLPGSHFAGYRIEALIGGGSHGWVYRATHKRLNRRTALKILRPEVASDQAAIARFRRECQLAGEIKHPNVVRVYAADDVDGRFFIAMRDVGGFSLKDIVREGPLEPKRAAAIIAQVAAGLDAAHALGLTHRDVNCRNVLLEHRGDVEHAYLSDFGFARARGEDWPEPGELDTGIELGKKDWLVEFASPELITGDPAGPASDIYQLGCTLYECLTGRWPWEGSWLRVCSAHLFEPVPSAMDLVASVPFALDDAVRRAMSKEPNERYPTAGSFGAAAIAAATEA